MPKEQISLKEKQLASPCPTPARTACWAHEWQSLWSTWHQWMLSSTSTKLWSINGELSNTTQQVLCVNSILHTKQWSLQEQPAESLQSPVWLSRPRLIETFSDTTWSYLPTLVALSSCPSGVSFVFHTIMRSYCAQMGLMTRFVGQASYCNGVIEPPIML